MISETGVIAASANEAWGRGGERSEGEGEGDVAPQRRERERERAFDGEVRRVRG